MPRFAFSSPGLPGSSVSTCGSVMNGPPSRGQFTICGRSRTPTSPARLATLRTRRGSAALADFDRLVSLRPESAVAHGSRGQVLRALNIPEFGVEGYEADDIIATLATQAEADGYPAGALAMANAGPDTAGSQFFFISEGEIVLVRQVQVRDEHQVQGHARVVPRSRTAMPPAT